jgi:hypothetical protein
VERQESKEATYELANEATRALGLFTFLRLSLPLFSGFYVEPLETEVRTE